jgi:ATP-dependent Clp protease protease subunit
MSKHRKWYRIVENAAEDEAEVYIYGDIGASWYGDGVEAKQFAEELAAIDAKTLRVRINSGGGSVFEGVAIASAIRRHPARTVSHVDGLAASAASFIALAADEVRMSKGAFFMIHNARAVAIGESRDMRETADVLDKITGSIRDAYVDKTGKPAEEITAWMDAETWFTAEEAKDAGFVDAIDNREPVKAEFDPSFFNKVPAALLERTQPPRKIETKREFEDALCTEFGFTREQAKGVTAHGFRPAAEPRDEATPATHTGSEPRDEAGAVDVAALTRLLSTLRS